MPERNPVIPPEKRPEVITAIQAMARGEAQPHQQKLLLDYMINDLCGTYDLSFRPEGDRETVFAEGKRFVGLHLVTLTKVQAASYTKDREPTEQG